MSAVDNARREARRKAREKEIAEWRERCRALKKSGIDPGPFCSGSAPETTTVNVSASAVASITNNQHPGVDEGGIVKLQGDILIVLRRGRLFTIRIGGRQLDSLDVADASAPDAPAVDSERTWYDELLVWERTVVVIGFSYARGGTEIGLFDLHSNGQLRHRATYHLRSDDYYSGTNYASRLIGDRLILFTSFYVPETADPHVWLPAIRRWHSGNSAKPFDPIAPITRIFRPVIPVSPNLVIHTMVSCDLAAPSFSCEATVILGDHLTVYYASPAAAYAWTSDWTETGPWRSLLYRIPFDGSPVTAIGVTGTPSDQLAFFEDPDANLNVIVSHPNDVTTLLRLPPSAFSDGSTNAQASHYRSIAHGLGSWLTTRFVGRYVLVGTSASDADKEHARTIVVTPWAGGSTFSLRLNHDAQRIEAMGENAVVIGSGDRNLSMTAIRLDDQPGVASTLLQQDAFQSEDRSHAFFYRDDTPDTGVFGLPVVTMKRDKDGVTTDASARILFVRNRALAFSAEGALDASVASRTNDECRASCWDWYGNARPIFVDGRIFALLGYEIVEGRLGLDGVEEVRRLDFMPRLR